MLSSPSEQPPPNKKAKVACDAVDANVKVMGDRLLSMENEELILKGEWLINIHINIAQQLLHQQFPNCLGCILRWFCHQQGLLYQLEQVAYR